MNSTTRNAATLSGISNLVLLDLQNSLVGRRLCETGVGVLEETGTASWQSPGAVDRSEWVNQIRTTSTITGPYQLQEDGHANYWGSWRCATACGSPATAARSAAARACAWPTGSTHRASRSWACSSWG
jgi:hypothetical protein